MHSTCSAQLIQLDFVAFDSSWNKYCFVTYEKVSVTVQTNHHNVVLAKELFRHGMPSAAA